IGLIGRRRQREVGLVGLIADLAIAEFVLVVAGRWHPGTVTSAAAIVLPEIPPGPHPVIGDIGVTEIPIEQMKQRPQPLHAKRGVARRRRTTVVIHVWGGRYCRARGRHVPPAQGRRTLITEAGERERDPALWGGAEGAEPRRSALMQRTIQISGVCLQ